MLQDFYWSWCRHKMEIFSLFLDLCAGNSPIIDEFPAQGQWRRALMFSLFCVRINGWVNNCEAGDLIRHHTHYDATTMLIFTWCEWFYHHNRAITFSNFIYTSNDDILRVLLLLCCLIWKVPCSIIALCFVAKQQSESWCPLDVSMSF